MSFDALPRPFGNADDPEVSCLTAGSFTELRDDLRLKLALKRGVSRENVPAYLIESIQQVIARG